MVKDERKDYNPKDDPEVREFKTIVRAILIVALIMIFVSVIQTLFISSAFGNVQTSQTDLNYIYSETNFFNSSYSEAPIQDPIVGPNMVYRNMRSIRKDTKHYNATYSFENDIIGSEPIGWYTSQPGGSVNIIEEKYNHRYIVQLIDINNSETIDLYQTLGSQFFGTMEWWWLTNDTSQDSVAMFRSSLNNIVFFLGIIDDKFQYYDGAWHDVGVATINNLWYDISIDFDCTTGAYDGLAQYKWNIEINDIEYGDFGFMNNDANINLFTFTSEVSDFNYFTCIDAIGYSWDANMTYDFNQDIIGQEPENWISDNGIDCSTLIKSELDGETNVLELYDNNLNEISDIYTPIKQSVNQLIEFDIAKSEIINKRGFIFLRENISTKVYLNFYANDFYSHAVTIKENFLTVNTFFRIKIILNDTANTFNCYIDNVLEGINLAYFSSSTISVDNIRIFTADNIDYSFYIDNIFVSSDAVYNYQKGDNKKPYLLYYDEYEVDTWDFWYEGEGDKLLTGDDNPNGWSDIEDGADDVNCLQDSVVQISGPSARDVGLEKNDFGFQWTEKLELFFGFNVKSISETLNNYVDFYIYSYDSTEIARIYFEGDGTELGYYDGSRNVLTSGLSEDYWYYIWVEINYLTDTCYLELGNYTYEPYTQGKMDTIIDNFQFDLTTSGKDGLSEVKVFVITDTGTTNFYLDYVGVYINYTSVSDEFGWFGLNILTIGEYVNSVPLYYDYWSFVNYSMVRYNIKGEQIGIYMWLNEFMFTTPPTPVFTPLIGAKDYDGSEQFFNVGDFRFDPAERYMNYIYGGVLWFTFYQNFSFTWLDIYGLTFSDGSEIWSVEFETGSLDPDDSKFWVSDNKFYFSMTTDDDNTEFVEVSFKLYDDYWQYGNWVFTVNRSLCWGGIIDQVYLFADFKVNYANGEYNSFRLKNSYQFTNQLIGQELVIISFSILISDNDNDFDNTINGYLEPMILYWHPGAALDIIITNYINIIPGVLLISIISMTIWAATKKKVGNMLVIPSIAFTSFLAYISDFIPLWILFIMLTSCATLVYSKWKDLFLVFTSFMTMILAFLYYGGVIDFWLFYGSFMLTIGYTIFVGVKDIKGERIS